MLIGGQILVAHRRKRRYSSRLQNPGDIPAIAFAGPLRDYRVEFPLVTLARSPTVETIVVGKTGLAHRCAQLPPLFFAADRDTHPFIGISQRLVSLVRRHHSVV